MLLSPTIYIFEETISLSYFASDLDIDGLLQVPDDFVPARPQILIPQLPGVALTEDQDEEDDDDYGEQQGEYGEDKEEETLALKKSIDFSHALV